MKTTKIYTNRFGRKMELVERADKKTNRDPLHTYPVEAGETIELARIKGVRREWRIWRAE